MTTYGNGDEVRYTITCTPELAWKIIFSQEGFDDKVMLYANDEDCTLAEARAAVKKIWQQSPLNDYANVSQIDKDTVEIGCERVFIAEGNEKE